MRFERGANAPLNTLLFYSGRVKERLRLSYQKSSPFLLREMRRIGVRVLVIRLKSPKSEVKIEVFGN
jgi:hypothetical protein